MTLDGGWGAIIASVVLVLLSGIGIVIWSHLENAQKDAQEALKLCREVRVELLEYKEKASEKFARDADLKGVLAEIFKKLDEIQKSLSNKQDRVPDHNKGQP